MRSTRFTEKGAENSLLRPFFHIFPEAFKPARNANYTKRLAPPGDWLADRRFYIAQSIYLVGILVCIMGAFADLLWGSTTVAWANLVVAASCAASYLINRFCARLKRLHRYSWAPAFSITWLLSFPALYLTGGILSPLLGSYLVLMLLASVSVQTIVRPERLFTLAMSTLVFWWLVPINNRLAAVSPQLVFVKTSLLLGCGFAGILTFFEVQRRLVRELISQSNELVEARAHLVHAAKMAEVGTILATTAHEMGQPAQVILSTVALLERLSARGTLAPQQLQQLLTRLSEASSRSIRLLSHLRSFSRKQPFEVEAVDVVEAVRSVHTMTLHDLRSRKIRFGLSLSEDSITTQADFLKLQQVLFNLISNARDACVESGDPDVQIRVEGCDRWTRIFVINNGPAIPLHVQERLFQAYFTTKARGMGTGLGLTICEQIVEQHGGRILFSSEPDKTIFAVYLPRKGPCVAANPGLRTEATPPSGMPAFQV